MKRFFIMSEGDIGSTMLLSTMLSKLSNSLSSKTISTISLGGSITILSHSHHHPHHISQ